MNRQSTANIRLVIWTSDGSSIHRRKAVWYVRDRDAKTKRASRDEAKAFANELDQRVSEGRTRILSLDDAEMARLLLWR